MCLAVPMKIVESDGAIATAEISGVRREVDLTLLPEAGVGDYVIVHAGFAISVLDEEEAQKTLALLAEAGVVGRNEA